MLNSRPSRLIFCLGILVLFVGTAALAQDPPPDNVAGNWTIYSNDPDGGTSAKYIEVKQNGNVLTGHFKGPHQSGGLQGSINGHHIVFSTKTRDVLTFRGMVDGNTMKGMFGNRGQHGSWQAVRTQ